MQGLTTETHLGKTLQIDGFPLMSKTKTVKSGNNLTRGTLVGVPRAGAVGAPAAGTNTGNGTITGTTTKGAKALAGVYTITCVTGATNGGLFAVVSPNLEIVGYAKVGTAFTSDHLSGFTINDGATDFALADSFTITVASGDGKLIAYNQTSSIQFVGILAEDANATSADQLAIVYTAGKFQKDGLIGYNAAYDDLLKSNLIFVKEGV